MSNALLLLAHTITAVGCVGFTAAALLTSTPAALVYAALCGWFHFRVASRVLGRMAVGDRPTARELMQYRSDYERYVARHYRHPE